MAWNYVGPPGLTGWGQPPELRTDPSVAPLANAIAELKYKQTQDFQKTLAQSIKEESDRQAANAALTTASMIPGAPEVGALEGMGTAGFEAYAGKNRGLAQIIQDQQDAAIRDKLNQSLITERTRAYPNIVDTPYGPMVQGSGGGYHGVAQPKEDQLTLHKYDAYAATEKELVKAAAKEAKENQSLAMAHPGAGFENKPFSQADQLAEVRKQMAAIESQQRGGGAGGTGAQTNSQFKPGQTLRQGGVTYIVDQNGVPQPQQ